MTTKAGEPERFYQEVVLTDDRGIDDPCLVWPFSRTGMGYANISVDGKMRYVHRRVCKAVRGDPPTPKHQAAHSCGNGHLACVTKSHLDWKTVAQNQADRVAHGTSNRGEQQGQAKLTEADVRELWKLKGSAPQRVLAERFGVHIMTVSDIFRRKTWAWMGAST